MTFKEDAKKLESIAKHRVKCKCSHVIIMPKADRTICSHCGSYVYRTPQIEFKYKTIEKLRKQK